MARTCAVVSMSFRATRQDDSQVSNRLIKHLVVRSQLIDVPCAYTGDADELLGAILSAIAEF
jgi:hypothetical protein